MKKMIRLSYVFCAVMITLTIKRISSLMSSRNHLPKQLVYDKFLSCHEINDMYRHRYQFAIQSSSGNVATSQTPVPSLKDIEWLRDCVTQALNKAFDPMAVYKQRALAKLKNLDQKKKGNTHDSTAIQDLDMIMEGKTVTFNRVDAMVTTATKVEFGDYQCNAAMTLAKSVGMAPRYRNVLSVFGTCFVLRHLSSHICSLA
jgi:hypothetical protein